jgi:hypothetical protein
VQASVDSFKKKGILLFYKPGIDYYVKRDSLYSIAKKTPWDNDFRY